MEFSLKEKFKNSYKVNYLNNKFQNILSSTQGLIHKNTVCAYWWQETFNFGDLLTPELLKSYNVAPIKVGVDKADLVSTGSILEHVPADFSGYILGSGLITSKSKNIFNNAKILGVRGLLTKNIIHAPSSAILGDPGLLAPRLIGKQTPKKAILGIVPHYMDKKDPRLLALKKLHQDNIRIIDVQRSASKVIGEINECEYILSSSLHGIICADALNIKNGWLKLSNAIAGEGFKFFDYHSALRIECKPVVIYGDESLADLIGLTRKVPDIVCEIQEQLNQMFCYVVGKLLKINEK